jgi:mitotic spindle assembly checkpoint protein MAD1
MSDLVPRAGWAAVCQENVQLEEELRQKEKRMLRLREVFADRNCRVPRGAPSDLGYQGRVLRQ